MSHIKHMAFCAWHSSQVPYIVVWMGCQCFHCWDKSGIEISMGPITGEKYALQTYLTLGLFG